MTDFFSLMSEMQSGTYSHDARIACLVGPTPSYFFSQLHARMRIQSQLPVERIACDQEEMASIINKCATTFLGQTYIYWLYGSELLSEQDSSTLMSYLQTYQGPHILIIVAQNELLQSAKKNMLQVAIPQTLTKKQLEKVAELLYPEAASSLYTKLQTTSISSEYTLDTATLTLSYIRLIGNSVDEFKKDWYPKLLPADNSLFTLSTHFFAQQKEQFFAMWSEVQHDYPDQFWIAFFSEQLFKAYGFIAHSRKNDHIGAKKMGYRLPYSFMRTDWKRYSLEQIAHMHHELYQLDYHIKQGGEPQFDLLFSEFFLTYTK
jgi:hypothetical protein